MSKKFSIVKTIDFDRLEFEVCGYMANNCGENPYIFMNRDTADVLSDYYKVTPRIGQKVSYPGSVVGEYMGNKVWINNDLGFGEIEIR